MSRRGNNPSRAERTQRRAAERVRRERKAMQIPEAVLALADEGAILTTRKVDCAECNGTAHG